ncbi:hypothetical protein ES703_75349 [subsurface metagenome]
MDNQNRCPICKFEDCIIKQATDGRLIRFISCKRCGDFQISETYFRSNLSKYGESHVLSGAIRNLYEKGEKINLFYEEDFKKILDSVKIPKEPFEVVELLIKHIYEKMDYPEKGLKVDANFDYALLYSKNIREFLFYVSKTRELGLIEPAPSGEGYILSLDGWEFIKELRFRGIKSKQAFVAMWFDSNLDKAWEEGFKPALEETGYKPLRIDLKEHNEKICDVIIAEIRDSGLLVADFTGQRGGVYFEAGFAKGLGIPIIWTCKKGDEGKLHFDTRQYKHIIWTNPKDLKKQLINRIKATLPKREVKGLDLEM